MKSIEEVGKIFLEEAKKVVDENLKEFSDCADANLNKTPDAAEKYNALLEKFKGRLPARGVTEEELNNFLPHIIDYQVELVPYIVNKINPELLKKKEE